MRTLQQTWLQKEAPGFWTSQGYVRLYLEKITQQKEIKKRRFGLERDKTGISEGGEPVAALTFSRKPLGK